MAVLLVLPLPPCHRTTGTSTSPGISLFHNRQRNRHHHEHIALRSKRPDSPLHESHDFLLYHLPRSTIVPTPNAVVSDDGGGGGRKGGGGRWGGASWWWGGGGGNHHDDDGGGNNSKVAFVSILSVACCLRLSSIALARTTSSDSEAWEVKGGRWTRIVPSKDNDDATFIAGRGMPGNPFSLWPLHLSLLRFDDLIRRCKDVLVGLMLPEGYPDSVTSDYLEYSLWRAVQGVASQISGVLSTQALLYAVGLGKGAIPTAAAINWVLKDGIGYLSKIMLSKYGRHFDVHPKGWRLFADLLENAAYGLEILTPAFPHLFVVIGAVAGAGRSAATLIQAATRSCFFAGFAAQRNFAEVIAKGEAQGMVSKFIGIGLGIALANYIGTSTPSALTVFCIVTGIHMYCNLKSYQSIQVRTLNPYRASLVFSEYLFSGDVPSVKEVNSEEPIFPVLPLLDAALSPNEASQTLSSAAKYAALQITHRLQLGCKPSEIIECKADAIALFKLYKDEGYMLAEKQGKFCIMLKESYTSADMLKAVFHVNYLYWLEANVAWLEPRSIQEECMPGGRLHISLDYARREFNHVRGDGQQAGWITDGLIARPSPCRFRLGYN